MTHGPCDSLAMPSDERWLQMGGEVNQKRSSEPSAARAARTCASRCRADSSLSPRVAGQSDPGSDVARWRRTLVY
jgi:hypothetical protein